MAKKRNRDQDEVLTTRQRQSQQIMREKAARKKRKALIRKVSYIGGGVVCLALLGGGVWGWKSGAIGRSATAVVDGAYGLTTKAGFSLQAMYVEGRRRTSLADIEKALGVKKGDPVLRISLNDMKQRLEKIESIRTAAVERALPGTLYVRIVEREPVALWQHNGKVSLVDDNGVAMNDIDPAPYHSLPLIIGDDAPRHVDEIRAILASQPDLAKRFTAAIRIGERRWNIRMGAVEVKLPEGNPFDAWKKLATMQDKQQLLDRNVKVIDLRLPDRLFITPGLDMDARNAKET